MEMSQQIGRDEIILKHWARHTCSQAACAELPLMPYTSRQSLFKAKK